MSRPVGDERTRVRKFEHSVCRFINSFEIAAFIEISVVLRDGTRNNLLHERRAKCSC